VLNEQCWCANLHAEFARCLKPYIEACFVIALVSRHGELTLPVMHEIAFCRHSTVCGSKADCVGIVGHTLDIITALIYTFGQISVIAGSKLSLMIRLLGNFHIRYASPRSKVLIVTCRCCAHSHSEILPRFVASILVAMLVYSVRNIWMKCGMS
jgi:hypothetical protein